MMNPYLIPGLESTPYAPLCPHLNEDHHTFYVPVDDTEKEFFRFQDRMNSVGWLIERGRLVVVTGASGCGKTSLINRCAAWLRDELARAQLTGEIFTLTDSCTPNQSIMLRMEQVVTELVDNLRDERRGVNTRHIDLLESRIRETRELQDTSDRQDRQDRHAAMVDRVYRYLLRDALPDDRVAIILLPPSSAMVAEIESYANFARHPRIVFFAETDRVDDLYQMWHTILTNDRTTPILLKVGLLNAGDSWTYARARQGSDPAGGSYPTVSEETMQRVTSAGVRSLRWLHALLHLAYEKLDSQDTREDLLSFREVSFEYIAECYLRSRLAKPGNMS